MNTYIKSFIQIILFSVCTSVVFAVEPEQISSPRPNDHGIHYGLPGWEKIDTYGWNESVLPSEGKFLYVNLNPQHLDSGFIYGGLVYDEVTITNTGRIYLGHLPENYKIVKDAEGLIPFVEFTSRTLDPVDGSSSIGVR